MSSTRDFDPRTRAFSDEELKPQPMIKKSRKQFVPDEMKDDKYWARRRKNNMAAKRSRDARRMKENQIALRAGFLEKEVTMYIDPNTGGILFQALAAVFVAVSGLLLVFSGRIRQAIARMRRSARKDKDEEQE